MSQDTVVDRDATEDSRQRRRSDAARWFVVFQHGEPSPRMIRSWKRWEAVPENREAFDAVERLWRLANAVPPPSVPTSRERIADQYDGFPSVSSWLSARGEKMRAVPRRRIILGLAAAIVAVVVGLLWLHPEYLGSALPNGHTVASETGVAEHKELVFEDGTRIELGARTAVKVTFTSRARTVILERGEAMFNVAHDRQRPFHVNAGEGTITALGTAFNVQRHVDDQVVVTVTEGVVEITRNSTAAATRQQSAGRRDSAHLPDADKRPSAQRLMDGRELRLSGGQEVTYDAQGRFSPVRVADTSASAWRDGRLNYRAEPLRRVIQDVNRYSQRQLVLGDSAAGDLLYSGTVFERDIDEWITGLEKIYPEITLEMTDADHVVIRTRSAAADP